MAGRKIRAFLDTSVLLQYLSGKEELQRLFSEEVLERTEFATSTLVLAPILFEEYDEEDLDGLLRYVKLEDALPAGTAVMSRFRSVDVLRIHTNDISMANAARACDILLTYERGVVEAARLLALRSETPEEFLEELDRAA